MRLLLVTAVEAEAAAARTALPDARVVVGGVGPAASAAATAASIGDAELVVSVGIGGGFAPVPVGGVAVASSVVFADLGAEADGGFVPLSELGFGTDRYDVAGELAADLAARTGGHLGSILTVATVTGTAERAADLARRHPDAVAESMEGAGIAAAAVLHGVQFAEIRAISNMVGPRDRAAWRVPDALDALRAALAAAFG